MTKGNLVLVKCPTLESISGISGQSNLLNVKPFSSYTSY